MRVGDASRAGVAPTQVKIDVEGDDGAVIAGGAATLGYTRFEIAGRPVTRDAVAALDVACVVCRASRVTVL
jgi:hypothetical protein